MGPAMSITPCPYCETSNVEWLEQLSQDAWTDYYQCRDCEHIWPVVKDDFDTQAIQTAPPPVTENHK
jgi:hypothetical protein